MRSLSISPTPVRKLHESASRSTLHVSARLNPSAASDCGLSPFDGSESLELRTIDSRVNGTHGTHGHSGHGPGTQGRDDPEDSSPLLSPRRPSICSVHSYELYTPDEDRQVRRRLDRRLVAFMALLYSLSFLDRSNIGNARIAGLQDELKLSGRQYQWLLEAFYTTYIVFEWMTLMYRIVPPHIYISACILSWGIIASLQATATSFGFLLVLRALLGVGEAAFGPGVPFYLSFFYRRNELALRTGLFISASPLSSSFAGGLAWLITKLGEHGPISPWRLLFLVEGFPSVLVAIWAWEFVPDGPGTAKWLSPRQQEVAVLRLRQEREVADEDQLRKDHHAGRERRRGVNIREVLQTLTDPKCYLTAGMFLSCNVAFSSMPVFLPTIIKDMGYSSIQAQALSAPPYLFAFVVVIATAYISDRYQTRSYPIIFHSLLASTGYVTLAISGYYQFPNVMLRYLALYPAMAGFFSAITIIITWNINNQGSDSKKGTGMAILNVIGQMGPLIGIRLFPEEDSPWYTNGMAICASYMLFVAILAMVLRIVLAVQNRRLRRERRAEYAGVPLEEGGKTQGECKPFEFIL